MNKRGYSQKDETGMFLARKNPVKSGFFYISIFYLVLLLTTGAGCRNQQEELYEIQPTQTYHNDMFGFSFQYPKEWVTPAIHYPMPGGYTVFSAGPSQEESTQGVGDALSLQMAIRVVPQKEYQRVAVEDYAHPDTFVTPKVEQQQIGGLLFDTYTYRTGGPEASTEMTVVAERLENNRMYTFEFFYALQGCELFPPDMKEWCKEENTGLEQQTQNTIDTILSSFSTDPYEHRVHHGTPTKLWENIYTEQITYTVLPQKPRIDIVQNTRIEDGYMLLDMKPIVSEELFSEIRFTVGITQPDDQPQAVSLRFRVSGDRQTWSEWHSVSLTQCDAAYGSTFCTPEHMHYTSDVLGVEPLSRYSEYSIVLPTQVEGMTVQSVSITVSNLVPAEQAEGHLESYL